MLIGVWQDCEFYSKYAFIPPAGASVTLVPIKMSPHAGASVTLVPINTGKKTQKGGYERDARTSGEDCEKSLVCIAYIKIRNLSFLYKLITIFVLKITSPVRYRSGVKFFHNLSE